MNKIFKIIWSKARNCYVVVSEIAHCRGKGQGQKRAVFTCSLAAALTVFTLAGGIVSVQAVETVKVTGGTQSVTNAGTESIVIGPDAKNESTQSDGVIVIGHGATVSDNGKPTDSIAIGTSANVVGENNIAIGTKAAVTNNGGNNAISLGTEAKAEKSESIAIGMNAHANNNDGIAAIAIGSGSEAQKDKSIAIGYQALAKNNGESGGIAIGSSIVNSDGTIITQTTAAQGNDIAFGVGAQTNNRNMNGHNGGAIAIGHLSYSNGNQDVAIGDNAKTDRHGTEGEGYVAIGANSFSNVGPGVVGYGYDFHDFQTKGSQTNEYAAVWKSTNGAVSVGNVSDSDHTKWITRQITGVAAGSADTDAVNVAQLKAAISSVNTDSSSSTSGDGVHYYSVLSDEKGSGSNYDNQGAKGKNSLAAGVRASTAENAENAVAIGYKAKADGVGATVIGQYGTASGRYALAFGGQQTDNTAPAANNQAIGDNSVAFGERSKASGSNSTAFGQATQALEERATAFGQRTTAKQSNATAFGQDTVADGQNATAFGNLTVAQNYGATAFGNKNKAIGMYATAWGGGDKVVDNGNGTTKKVGTVASGLYATAFGERTEARGESATAFGSDSIASGKDSLAFGTGSKASGNNSLAGLGGTATTANSIALGNNTKANNKDNAVSVAIGENAEASGERSLAIGFGVSEKVNGQDDTTLTSTKASGESAIAIGTDVVAKGQHSVAMGSHTDAAKDSSVAIGFDTHTVSDSAVAIGSGTRAEGRYSVALGLSSVAGKETNDETNPLNGGGSVAIGYGTSAKASRSIAIGTGATAANADFTTALGDSANAQQRGSIAIGAGSVATRAAGNKEGGTAYKEAYLIPDVSKATDAEKAIWTSTEGAVSVGGTAKYQEYDENGKKVTKTKPLTRQITNVAAGSEDTDAVNVAQLKQAGFTVTANTDAATGSNIKMGNTLDFKAEDNAIVSTTKDSKTITVKVSKTPTFDSVTTGDTVINNAGLTVGGKTYVSNAGLNANNKVITNVANGKADNDAVNVSQLKDSRTMVTSSDQSIQVADTANGNPNHAYDIKVDYGKVADNTSISYKANGGTAQSVTLKNGLNFTNGANTTAEVGADGVVKVNATDMRVQSGTATYSDDGNGSISMTHHDGTTATISGLKDTYTRSASYDAANKKATFTRNDNTTYDLDLSAIANEAGNGKLNFKGDDETVIARKLNEQLDIVGGADAKKLTDKNIGVNNVGGQLKIQLAKDIDLTKSGSVKMGDTTINNTGLTIHGGPSITQTHIDAGSKTIINVAPGENGTDAVNVNQLNEVKNVASAHSTVSVGGQKAQKDGKEVKGGNLILTRTQDEATHAYNYDVKLGNDITVGEKGADGKDGKIGVNGKNGSSVVINGKDGSIGLTGPKGADGTPGASLTMKAENGRTGLNGKDGTTMTRIVYGNHEVATLDDGLKFAGDDGQKNTKKVIHKKLDEQLNIVGGADAKKLTDKNIGVNNVGGQLKIQLAKDIDLTKSGSVKMGDTTINNTGLTIHGGPSITQTHIDAGSKTIINVAPGENGTDAVNVNQLNEVKNVASAHSTVSVGGQKAQKDGKEVKGGNLILTRTQDEATHAYNYDVKLGNDITVGEKGADGKDGKISVNGKNGSSVVINGKDGTIGLNGKNGTNGLTIRGAAGKDGITRIVYKDAAGKDHPVATLDDGLKFKGDTGDVISKKLNQRMDIVGGANKNNLSENNIGVISDNGKLHVKLAKDLKDLTSVTTTDGNGNTTVQNGKGVTVKDSQNNTSIFTAKDITFTNRDKSHKTKLDEDGLIIFTKGTSGQANQTIKITNTYISMGGQQIHNVLAGKADTDAVNVSQLKAVQSVAEAHSTVSVGGKKAGKDSVDVKGGNLVLKRTENTNGSKNYDVKLADDISIKSVTTTDDKGNKTVQKGGGITTIDKDGNKTSVTGKGVTTVDKEGNKTSLTGKGMTTVDKEGNKTSVTGKGVSISGKDGNKTTITEKGLTIKGGPVVTKDKFSAGGQQIHDVVAGTADTDAVNVSQLKEEIGKVEQHHTEVTVNGGTEAQEGTYNPSGNLQIKKTTDKDTGKKTYDLKLADNLTFGAKDGADGKEGVDGSIGVNGRNGSAVVINGQDGSIGLNGADGKNGLTIKGANGTVGVDGQAGTTRLIYETKDGETTVKHEVATMDDGMKFAGDSGEALKQKLNSTTNIKGGAAGELSDGNIGVVSDGKDTLTVKLAKDIRGLDSVEATTVNATTVNSSSFNIAGDSNHSAITIQQGNVNMGGNKIEGVAPGKVSQDSTDAVNGSQLWQRDQAINGLSGSVNKLGNRINRVGAGAAALAALHPLDFDPDDKWDFAAGYGNYRGANAAAVGAYYRPNEDTMFSVGGSFGGGENMVNAGVSIKLGQGNHVSTSRVAMAKEMKAMRQHMAEQDALIAKLQSMHGMAVDPAKSTLFPDVAENHWAYQYVTTLAKKGILEGYPDGEFKGDRMMTRYEFAAIVYRIVESGVGSTDPELSKLVKEFSPELQYIRIDTIQKDRDGKPTIERVRVISDAK